MRRTACAGSTGPVTKKRLFTLLITLVAAAGQAPPLHLLFRHERGRAWMITRPRIWVLPRTRVHRYIRHFRGQARLGRWGFGSFLS